MKANELMIGDFVQMNGSPYVIEEISKKGWVHMTDPVHNLRVQMSSDYILDFIEGVPLTVEILEANGWEKVPQPGCANPYHWQLTKYEDDKEDDAYLLYRVKAYETFFRGMLISISRPACEDITFRKQVEHVHELQHALRLCGIEKEIIIKN